MKQIKGLDTLRAFAVFFVFIQHGGVWFDNKRPLGHFISNVVIPDGGFGVHLFFVLSGFLITSILLNEKIKNERNSKLPVIKNFFVRRALRIFPIYYLLIFLLLTQNYSGLKEHIGYYLTYTSNILCYRSNSWTSFSHSWTLSVEEQFYLIWPWSILFVNKKRLKYVFFVAIIVGVITTYYNGIGHMEPILVWNCFDAFGIGGLYAYARLDEKWNKKFEKMIKIIGCIALALYCYWKLMPYLGYNGQYIFLSKTSDSILSVWLILLVIKCKSGWVKKYFLENKALNYLGRISYGFYLYHYVYLFKYMYPVDTFLDLSSRKWHWLEPLVHNSFPLYWIHFLIIVLISSISYYLIEKPILRLKRFFKYEPAVIPVSS